jgi:HD-like signal output (HDOD) protein
MTRVLFVDDEPRVLQGLRQILRGKRKAWDMVFAEGGPAALVELERNTFDAVVSDMRMPNVDGAELLRRVRDLQPGALRVVLSGQMDESAAVRAAATAHRFLAKPCDSEALIATLARALELRARLTSDEMRRCVGGIAGLPSPPASCVALDRALQNEETSLAEIAAIVEADVGMSVKVLQLVNSAFFGLSRQISSVELAVKYLGVSALRSLLVAHALFERLAGHDEALLLSEQSKSLLAARYARAFPLSRRDSQTATTAALLHNVGRLALMSRRAEEYAQCHLHAREHGVSLEKAEREVLGVTNCEVGAYLLGLWGLPEEVMDAVATYPDAFEAERLALDPSSVVHMAQLLAREALGETDLASPSAKALGELGVVQLIQGLRSGAALDARAGGA